jgi:hypothetical protein
MPFVAVELVHLDDVAPVLGNVDMLGRAVADVGDVERILGPEVLCVLEAAQVQAFEGLGQWEGIAIADLIEGHGIFLRVVTGGLRLGAIPPVFTEAGIGNNDGERYN